MANTEQQTQDNKPGTISRRDLMKLPFGAAPFILAGSDLWTGAAAGINDNPQAAIDFANGLWRLASQITPLSPSLEIQALGVAMPATGATSELAVQKTPAEFVLGSPDASNPALTALPTEWVDSRQLPNFVSVPADHPFAMEVPPAPDSQKTAMIESHQGPYIGRGTVSAQTFIRNAWHLLDKYRTSDNDTPPAAK